jgi:hypothetical protein
MVPTVRFRLYAVYLEYFRSEPLNSQRAEIRIALALLVGRVLEMKSQSAEIGVQQTSADGATDEEAKSDMSGKADWLLEEIYRDIREVVSARSICLLARFFVRSNAEQIRREAKGKQVMEEKVEEGRTEAEASAAVLDVLAIREYSEVTILNY